MFYQVFLNNSSKIASAGAPYVKEYSYPFPMSGRYRVRITGFQFYAQSILPSGIILNSRTMKNPLTPYLYQFINKEMTFLHSQFAPTGWFECELGTAIDFTLRSVDTATIDDNIMLIMNFEVEPLQ